MAVRLRSLWRIIKLFFKRFELWNKCPLINSPFNNKLKLIIFLNCILALPCRPYIQLDSVAHTQDVIKFICEGCVLYIFTCWQQSFFCFHYPIWLAAQLRCHFEIKIVFVWIVFHRTLEIYYWLSLNFYKLNAFDESSLVVFKLSKVLLLL